MRAFTEAELSYLRGGHRLGRLATVGRDRTPHVVPVGWTYNAEHDLDRYRRVSHGAVEEVP